MKKLSLSFGFLLLSLLLVAQTKEQSTILNDFITMHRLGDEQAIQSFIKSTYHPEYYKKIDLKAHVNFYATIIDEFGQLEERIYKKIEASSNKLVIHLTKKGEGIINKHIDPANVLVVEIETSDRDSKYMEKSLGLGSLLCQQKKGRR